MKTNGLRNKKPAMARAAWRKCNIRAAAWAITKGQAPINLSTWLSVLHWHRAAKGRK